MWLTRREYRVFDVGRVQVGGAPGLRPTVLIGTIFHHRHRVVEDEAEGRFNRDLAERLINAQETYSDKTGNPCMVDVVGSNPHALHRYVEFVASVTEAPILLDGTTAETRVEALQSLADVGLKGRLVYNSITPSVKEKELTTIQEAGLEAAVLLSFDASQLTTKGRVEAVHKMLGLVGQYGVSKPLIDTCVLDLPSLGPACSALYRLKEETGLPVGCGAHNAVSLWRGLKSKLGEQAVKPCVASAVALASFAGADFVLYGPIDDAPIVFPAVAMVDVALSQLEIEALHRPPRDHPRYRVA
jgi:tetrahydromethanopterin S-methyltransferase subunit H